MIKETINFTLSLACWGTWKFDRELKEISFIGEDGTFKQLLQHPLLLSSGFIEIWKNERSGVVLIFDHYGKQVYRMNGKSGEIREIVQLNRREDMDYGMAFSKFEEYEETVLLIYERGVICFDKNANLLWKQDHDKYDWIYTGVRDNLVCFRSEFRGEWAYKLSNGEKVDLIGHVSYSS